MPNLKTRWLNWPILALFIFSLTGIVNAQNELVTKTLDKSRQLIDVKNFSEATEILGSFENQYPGNIYVERLYAQTLFWMHNFDLASTIYERAIDFHPHNMDVKYEYAIMLFDYKEYDKAKKLLLEYTTVNPGNGDAEFLLGKIYYYQRRFHDAVINLRNAIRLIPDYKDAKELYREVYHIIAPQLGLGGSFRIDEQPMNAIGPKLRFNWYRSDMIDIGISGDATKYFDVPASNVISSVKISNKFNFVESGINVKIAAGGIYSKLETNFDWLGEFQLVKKFRKSFQIELLAKRKNYDYTVSSITNLLLISQYALNISIGNQNGWNGMIGMLSNFFPDDNYVNSNYLWLLSRPIKVSNFKFYFGYAFSYMNSKEDRFESADSLSQIISGSSDKIEGIYNPYYTPINQLSNSLLTNITFTLGSHLALYGHASVGLYSTIDAPYLYLDNNEFNNTVIVKGYSNQRYIPLDIGIKLKSELSNKLELNISYTYLSTYYFVTNNIDVGVKIYLK